MMDISDLYNEFLASGGVCTDTRTLWEGQLFFALKGESFDGDSFVAQALEKGARLAVASQACPLDDPRIVKVPDTLRCLQELAAHHRRQLHIPVIGLTGTNGKTTTKELIRCTLAQRYRVRATQGNLNNDIGVPLTVLGIQADDEIAIVEMGASHPEDLRPLLAVAQPTHGLITNVGKAHLLGFGSYEGVKHAKGLLYDWLIAHGGTIFAHAADPVLAGMLAERGASDVVRYGEEGARVLPASPLQPYLRLRLGRDMLETQLVGAYNTPNILAALCVGAFFGVPKTRCRAAISAYVPSNNRSQLVRTERNTLIVDAYNANPSSMAVALDNLALCEGRKVALLGDMRELGADAAAEHRKVVERLLTVIPGEAGGWSAFLVGEEFAKAAQGTSLPVFPSSEALADYLKAHPLQGCTILVKGSRGIQMEKVIASL